jgi:hypothetical protein
METVAAAEPQVSESVDSSTQRDEESVLERYKALAVKYSVWLSLGGMQEATEGSSSLIYLIEYGH